MINKMAYKIVQCYIAKNKIDKENEELYVYSFELLISTVFNLLIILILSLIAGLILEGIIFSVCFMVMRGFAGGYHSETHCGCIFTLSLIFSLYIVLYKFLDTHIIYFMSIAMMVVSLIIPILAPVDSINKPLTIKECKINKKKTIISYCIFMLAGIVLIGIEITRHYAFAIAYPMFMVALLLVTGLIKNKLQIKKINIQKESDYEQQ